MYPKADSGQNMVADYRVASRNKVRAKTCVSDAKSAVRWIREHAGELGVDPDRIAAGGGSAGGHLAAATALIEEYNENTDNLSVSCIPNALVLSNPVIDNGPGGYGYERIGSEYKNFSPLHNIKEGAPPTIFFLGTNDNLIGPHIDLCHNNVHSVVGTAGLHVLIQGLSHLVIQGSQHLGRPCDTSAQAYILN